MISANSLSIAPSLGPTHARGFARRSAATGHSLGITEEQYRRPSRTEPTLQKSGPLTKDLGGRTKEEGEAYFLPSLAQRCVIAFQEQCGSRRRIQDLQRGNRRRRGLEGAEGGASRGRWRIVAFLSFAFCPFSFCLHFSRSSFLFPFNFLPFPSLRFLPSLFPFPFPPLSLFVPFPFPSPFPFVPFLFLLFFPCLPLPPYLQHSLSPAKRLTGISNARC